MSRITLEKEAFSEILGKKQPGRRNYAKMKISKSYILFLIWKD